MQIFGSTSIFEQDAKPCGEEATESLILDLQSSDTCRLMVSLGCTTRLRVFSATTGKQNALRRGRVENEVQTNRGDYVIMFLIGEGMLIEK